MEEFKVEERKEGRGDGRRGHVPRGCARGVGQVLAARTCQKEVNKTHHRCSPWEEQHQKERQTDSAAAG